MNKKEIKRFQIISGIIDTILGTLLHFTYEWSNKNTIVGIFSAINESTWEHLKLLFFPMLITTVLGYIYLNKRPCNFLCAKTIGILVAMSFTVIFFYTYIGVLGKMMAIINILSFFVTTYLGEYIAYKIMISYFKCNTKIVMTVLAVLIFLFIIFTFKPPKIGLFEDPITGSFGIELD